MLHFYAAKAAAVDTCGRSDGKTARFAALRAEEAAALDALVREWTAKRDDATRRVAFENARREVMRPPTQRPIRRNRPYRPPQLRR